MKTVHNLMFPIALTALAVPTFGQNKACSKKGDRPNIIYMMADDHALNAVSAYNSRLAALAPTKNIDRLAKEGMIFTNCFANNSISTPSRACILTGKLSHKNGVLDLADAIDSTTQVTYPQLLQKAGYYTGMFGKWHLHAMPYGFDEWKVMVGQGNYHNPFYWEKGMGWKKNNKGAKQYHGYVTDITTSMAVAFLENRPKDRPFALMLHFKAPHDPFDYNKKYESYLANVDLPEPSNLFDDYATRGRGIKECTQHIGECHTIYREETQHLSDDVRKREQYQIYLKRYLRCIASIDENVGKLLDYLDQNGLSDNTIIIYTSDQGFFLGEHGLYDKRFMYEESMRVPFLIRYPKKIKANSVNDELISYIDYCPTFLDYANVKIPEDIQGESLRPLLESRQAKWRDAIYYRYWMHGAHFNIPAHMGIRTKTDKLIFFYSNDLGTHHDIYYQDGEIIPGKTPLRVWEIGEPYWEYYNLSEDGTEMKNGYGDPENAKIIKKLKRKLTALRKYYDDTDQDYPQMQEIIRKYWNN